MKLSGHLRTLGRTIKVAFRMIKGALSGRQTAPPAQPLEPASRLIEFSDFGANPGRLRMFVHVSPSVTGGPLVVLLHGCGQNPAQFASDSGWIELADRLRFTLVLPQQPVANNASRCFQWFLPAQTTRDKGEAGSIAAMTRCAMQRFDTDASQVFIVGLSAGGAMAAAMLAAYPDLFAAGASVAGLPVGAARSGIQAMMRMASAGPNQPPADWAALVRAAAPPGFLGPWPRLSIWQGQADTTVAPKNGDLLATQWCALHGLGEPAMAAPLRNGVQHQAWPDSTRPLVELWSLPHLPHGYPVGIRPAAPRRFIEQAPIDATAVIAGFFGLEHDRIRQFVAARRARDAGWSWNVQRA
jgi:poly(hydroxyalkanoate) depolymerase family esterase